MTEEEKCLVTEAMDKCQCEWCKQFRIARELDIQLYAWSEVLSNELRKLRELKEEIGKLKNE